MICYVLAMGKQHLGPHVVVGYGIKIFWPGLFITSPDHLVYIEISRNNLHDCENATKWNLDSYIHYNDDLMSQKRLSLFIVAK